MYSGAAGKLQSYKQDTITKHLNYGYYLPSADESMLTDKTHEANRSPLHTRERDVFNPKMGV